MQYVQLQYSRVGIASSESSLLGYFLAMLDLSNCEDRAWPLCLFMNSVQANLFLGICTNHTQAYSP